MLSSAQLLDCHRGLPSLGQQSLIEIAERCAEHYYRQLDVLRLLRQEVRRDPLAESRKHKAWKLLRLIPGIGPIRAALLVALIQTPHRFRTKRQL
jgi:transposase